MKKLIRLWHTVKYLKLIQLYYQLRVRFFSRKWPKQLSSNKSILTTSLELTNSEVTPALGLIGMNNFKFLNIEHSFGENIYWNLEKHGKLWTYNLTYFEFLNQGKVDKKYALQLIVDFIEKSEIIKDGNEPYPTSLRCINWIKFICAHKINNEVINSSLSRQFNYLSNNLEYHLLGNHLLENGFSLLFGSYYFRNEQFYKKASSLLQNQLEEQVLDDGGHFELSPMYHKILLFRLLDSINVIANNPWREDDLLDFLKSKAQLMLGWLETITYSNGQTANVNDSANGITPSTLDLVGYAKKLNLSWGAQALGSSGYRMFKKGEFELLVDVGNIGPDYIPGHAHADTFNFELIVNGKPIIVDTGISTYEKNKSRQLERSTISHNTVIINNRNQSDVWGGFRVGKRAKIIKLEEDNSFIKASHNGYKELGVIHTRSFAVKENEIIVNDLIDNKSKNELFTLLHFHPNIKIEKRGKVLFISDVSLEISFLGVDEIKLMEFHFCEGFNKTKPSIMALISFHQSLTTTFLIK